jgi:hypothetical protein
MPMQFPSAMISGMLRAGGQTPRASSYDVADIEKFIQQEIFTGLRGLPPTVWHNLQLRTQINIPTTSTYISRRSAGRLSLLFRTLRGA